MIPGTVRSREARNRLVIRGQQRTEEVEAIIDTGYTAFLSLPPATVASLDLRWKTISRAILADGSECIFDVHVAHVVWDGEESRVLVDEVDSDPLVGMGLLSGCELKVHVRQGGKVTIKRLGPKKRHLR